MNHVGMHSLEGLTVLSAFYPVSLAHFFAASCNLGHYAEVGLSEK